VTPTSGYACSGAAWKRERLGRQLRREETEILEGGTGEHPATWCAFWYRWTGSPRMVAPTFLPGAILTSLAYSSHLTVVSSGQVDYPCRCSAP
jgi:hypothetical protein